MRSLRYLNGRTLSPFPTEAEQKRILYLRFRSGEVYRYVGFPENQYRELLDAESRGRHFLSHIRNQFRYERLAKLHAS